MALESGGVVPLASRARDAGAVLPVEVLSPLALRSALQGHVIEDLARRANCA